MRYITRSATLAIAVAAISFGGSLELAKPAEARHLRAARYVPPPLPPLWACKPVACPREVLAYACPWQAQAVAQYQDDRCRNFGPRGSPIYIQCRRNFDYECMSLPLRAIK